MSLLLICLIVTDTCNPLGFPFPIRITGDEFGCDLAEAVKSEVPHTHRNIDASDLRLWKPNHFFPSSPSHDLASHVDYLRLNASRNERNAIQLDTTAPLNEYFLSDIPLPLRVVHVVVQLPPQKQVPNRNLQPLLQEQGRYEPYNDNGNNSRAAKKQTAEKGQGKQKVTLQDRHVRKALQAAGFNLPPEDGLIPLNPLPPTIARVILSNGSHVILKLIDADTNELNILEYLTHLKSSVNHTIELFTVIDLPIDKVIAMPWGITLDNFLRYDYCPEAVESLGVQFLEGVAFMHEHKVAHLDLKPNNLVVAFHDQSSTRWLSIIDFGISVFVEGEETEVNGYRGTPSSSWVAPEVGSEDGPRRSYSAILADRWACGRMIQYVGEYMINRRVGQGEEFRMLSGLLLRGNPVARRPLKEVLDCYKAGKVEGVEMKRSVTTEAADNVEL